MPSMPEIEHPASSAAIHATAQPNRELHTLATGAKRKSFRQIIGQPVMVVAMIMGAVIVGLVFYLQQDPAALTLERPEAQYKLLQNDGITKGVPIAILVGPLTVFEINDPLAGGGGATRAKQVVESLTAALTDLEETPGRFITIQPDGEEGLPAIVPEGRSGLCRIARAGTGHIGGHGPRPNR